MSMLPDADFLFIAREVKARSGLVLDAEQAYLIETRLSPIAQNPAARATATPLRSGRS